MATEDIHPVLIDLLLEAAREVHSGGGLLSRTGEFPGADAAEYPMAADAERFYKSGPSGLRTYLPYWTVVWVERFIFFVLPALLVGIPLLRVLPGLYRWGVRRRIYRWYGELSFIERAAAEGRGSREAQLRRLDQIEERVERIARPGLVRRRGVHVALAHAHGARASRNHVGPSGCFSLTDDARAELCATAQGTFFQPLPGSKTFILAASAAEPGPRSFAYTTPSWLTMKVCTPELPYDAGHATTAKPPNSLPFTT